MKSNKQKKPDGVRPGRLFDGDELFLKTTFIRQCSRLYKISSNNSERIFDKALKAGAIEFVKNVGFEPGTASFKIIDSKFSVVIDGEEA